MRSRNRHLYGPRNTRAGSAVAAGVLALTLGAAASSAQEPAQDDPPPRADEPVADGIVRIDPRRQKGGDIPSHFVGFSIEWTLIERYMGPNARHGFANMLGNLDTGVLRIGGGSQDNVPFDAAAPNTNRVITPADLAAIRATLDLVNAGPEGDKPKWGTILGTAMAPTALRPVASVEHAARFTRQGVEPVFGDGDGRRYVAGIELGNEPDLNYHPPLKPFNVDAYLADFKKYTDAGVTGDFSVTAPNTSEPIARWQNIRDRVVGTRFFWDWPRILDEVSSVTKANPGALGTEATDHFYPMSRTCPTDEYRCPTIERLLSDERMSNFDYEVYTHAAEASRHDMGYRVEEMNTASGRGADGVSNTAASSVWALDTLFNAACPQPPDQPGANQSCEVGATGLHLHNAEVTRFFFPEEGNAFYNAVNYDPTPDEAKAGSPTAGPSYYAMLLFSKLAQGTDGLRPVAVAEGQANGSQVKAWQVNGERSERRLFLINKGSAPARIDVETPDSRVEIDRMTPHDPTGSGRTLDATSVRIDGRSIAADGSWPGLDPTVVDTHGGTVPVTVGAGEAVVVTTHGHDE